VWLAVFASGVHATVAGILVAMVIPVRPKVEIRDFITDTEEFLSEVDTMDLSPDAIISDSRQLNAVEHVAVRAGEVLPPGLVLEHALHPVQVWVILPLFALANAGVRIDSRILDALSNPISLGIILGLVVGKPLGVALMSWLVVRAGRASLPKGVNWAQITGAGCLAGIGFTMSLFISDLAFDNQLLVANAKVGILAASLLSGIIGFILLQRSLPKEEAP
jgi:NhaA family Na+:H+ antiporter